MNQIQTMRVIKWLLIGDSRRVRHSRTGQTRDGPDRDQLELRTRRRRSDARLALDAEGIRLEGPPDADRSDRFRRFDGKDQLINYEGCGCAGGQVTTIQSEVVPRDDQPTQTARRTQKVYQDVLVVCPSV